MINLAKKLFFTNNFFIAFFMQIWYKKFKVVCFRYLDLFKFVNFCDDVHFFFFFFFQKIFFFEFSFCCVFFFFFVPEISFFKILVPSFQSYMKILIKLFNLMMTDFSFGNLVNIFENASRLHSVLLINKTE